MMTEPQDRELSRLYRDAARPEPPTRLDEAILAASRRASGSRPQSAWTRRILRSGVPVALAATILLSFTVTLMVLQDSGDVVPPPLARKPAASEERAQPATSAPPRARSTPQADNRRDRGAESLALAEGSDASRPGFVRDAPGGSAGVALDSLGKQQRAQDSPDPGGARAARESESMAAAQPAPAAPPAPAPVAGPRLETALQRADAASRQRGGVVGSESKERQPEKWIEDIRRLKAQGRIEDAGRELAEFKKRHPEYRLPDDLR